jgi:predicted nucleic acid-binding protein
MAVLVDSNVFIEVERRGLRLGVLADIAGEPEAALSSITASELLVGFYRAEASQRRTNRETFLEDVFRLIPVLPFDLTVARVHARLSAQLTDAGSRIGAHDLIIAATALAHEYAVLTENVREFERVPGLAVRRPEWP